MSLESGIYIIQSKSQGGYVGRNSTEDRSLLPKKVVILPQGVEAPKWEIEKLDNGKYAFKTGGSHTAGFDKQLWAVLLPEPIATKWRIEPQPRDGENTYIIVNDDHDGWTTPSEPYFQLTVESLIATESLPPQYFPRGLFIITKV